MAPTITTPTTAPQKGRDGGVPAGERLEAPQQGGKGQYPGEPPFRACYGTQGRKTFGDRIAAQGLFSAGREEQDEVGPQSEKGEDLHRPSQEEPVEVGDALPAGPGDEVHGEHVHDGGRQDGYPPERRPEGQPEQETFRPVRRPASDERLGDGDHDRQKRHRADHGGGDKDREEDEGH